MMHTHAETYTADMYFVDKKQANGKKGKDYCQGKRQLLNVCVCVCVDEKRGIFFPLKIHTSLGKGKAVERGVSSVPIPPTQHFRRKQ